MRVDDHQDTPRVGSPDDASARLTRRLLGIGTKSVAVKYGLLSFISCHPVLVP
jgi:hypothetical protein